MQNLTRAKWRLLFFILLFSFFKQTSPQNQVSQDLPILAQRYAELKNNFQPQHGTMYIPAKKMITCGNFVKKETDICPFCMQRAEDNDTKNLIIGRSQLSVIALSFYPYADGHLLIIPERHVGALAELSKEERVDLMELVNLATDILKEVLHAEGVNVGINIGRAAGASIPDHLHIQIVPRWSQYRDTFLQIYNNISVITYSLPEMYALLVPAFKEKLEVYKTL
jgi:ATP adenylyltransferase